MKKILLIAAGIIAAAAWLYTTQKSEPTPSPLRDSRKASGAKNNIGGRKRPPLPKAPAQKKEPVAALKSDCLDKGEVLSKCTKTKGEKKSTSPTLKNDEGSLSEGNYSRLPE